MGLNSENRTRSEKKLHKVHFELASTRLQMDTVRKLVSAKS